jgi:hypothetical protein
MHIIVETKRFDATPREWLKTGAQCGELANTWSGRGDIIAYVGKGAGQGVAAALFNPVLAEMELNVHAAFGETVKPEYIGDLRDRDIQFEQPVACGAILHESMHAKHTHFDFAEVRSYKDPRIALLIEMFEEIRIETRGVEKWPRNRSFLRSCALKLVVDDMKDAGERAKTEPVMQLSKLMILTLGRVQADVLEPDDVKPVRDGAVVALGEDLVHDLTRLMWRATQHRDDEDWEPLRRLAEEWVQLLEDAGHRTQPTEEERKAAAAIAKAIGDMIGELPDMAGETETRARGEAIDQADHERSEAEAAEAAARAKEQDKANDEAGRVFGKGTTDIKGVGTKSKLVRSRLPTEAEHVAAVQIAQMLERARYRDRVVVQRTSQAPPGRLRSRTMVQAAAEQDQGRIQTAEPWRHKRRFHTEDPELRVGLMTDISGSMRSAMEPMAVTNWIFSEAGRRIQAKCASVYFGNSVFPGLAPGEHLDKVKIYSAADGTERFDSAFKALNGKLELLGSSGARLLVVVSDLHHTHEERKAERRWFGRCAQEGVAVLVLPFDARPYFVADTLEGLPAKALINVSSPVEAALEIGRACAEALEAVGNRA